MNLIRTDLSFANWSIFDARASLWLYVYLNLESRKIFLLLFSTQKSAKSLIFPLKYFQHPSLLFLWDFIGWKLHNHKSNVEQNMKIYSSLKVEDRRAKKKLWMRRQKFSMQKWELFLVLNKAFDFFVALLLGRFSSGLGIWYFSSEISLELEGRSQVLKYTIRIYFFYA